MYKYIQGINLSLLFYIGIWGRLMTLRAPIILTRLFFPIFSGSFIKYLTKFFANDIRLEENWCHVVEVKSAHCTYIITILTIEFYAIESVETIELFIIYKSRLLHDLVTMIIHLGLV